MLVSRPPIAIYLKVVAFFSAAAFATILIALGVQFKVQAAFFTGIATTVSLGWYFFDRYIWKWHPFKAAIGRPNLNGRWVGTLDRDGEESPHRFVLEIRQTCSTLACCTYTDSGNSNSYMAELLTENGQAPHTLVFNWFGGTIGVAKGSKTQAGQFYGTTKLRLVVPQAGSPQLTGVYYTDRRPRQTRGTLELEWMSHELKDSI